MDTLVVLRGGTRDGEQVSIDGHLRRLVTPSNAPGLLDVYEPAGERAHGADVWQCVGQEPATGIDATLIHMPGSNPVPGS